MSGSNTVSDLLQMFLIAAYSEVSDLLVLQPNHQPAVLGLLLLLEPLRPGVPQRNQPPLHRHSLFKFVPLDSNLE